MVAVEMWEPAFCAGFQAPGRGRSSGWELPRFPPARHFHSEILEILPIFVRICRRPLSDTKKFAFGKPAPIAHFYRFLCRATFISSWQYSLTAAQRHSQNSSGPLRGSA